MTAVFALQRKKLGCVKSLQNFCKICLFSLQNFAFWMQNLRFIFAKNRGDRKTKLQLGIHLGFAILGLHGRAIKLGVNALGPSLDERCFCMKAVNDLLRYYVA